MRIHVGIYGTGLAARGFAHFLRESGIPVTGWISGSPERAAALEAETGIPGFTTLEELLGAHPETSVMLIANANSRHNAAAIESLGRGLHVYCEKPMAPTLEESREMVTAEAASTGTLQVGFEYIHSTMPRRLTELQQEGFFGEMLSAGCVDSRGHWWSGHPEAPFEEQVKLRREAGGGIVYHCGIHQLDMLRAFLGDFHRVHAFRCGRNALPYYPDDVPDHVQVMLEGSEGKLGSLEIFHNRAPVFYRRVPAIQTDWAKMPGHEFRMSLVGTQGSALADFYDAKLHLFRFDHHRKETELVRTEDYGPFPQNELHHDMNGLLMRYLRNLEEGKGPLTPAHDAYNTMVLADAVERSIATRSPVQLTGE